jgi:hypothetical protein
MSSIATTTHREYWVLACPGVVREAKQFARLRLWLRRGVSLDELAKQVAENFDRLFVSPS